MEEFSLIFTHTCKYYNRLIIIIIIIMLVFFGGEGVNPLFSTVESPLVTSQLLNLFIKLFKNTFQA